MNKVILSAAVLAAITGTALAGGVNNTITGQFGADAVGTQNTVTGSSAFTAGYNNNVSGNNAVSYGVSNKATGINSIAGGEYSYAKGRNSVAIGSSAQALQDNNFAIGSQARANGEDALAFGNGAYSENQATVAVGKSTIAKGLMGTAVGYGTRATADYTTAVGYQNAVTGQQSSAIGVNNETTGQFASAVGTNNETNGSYAFAAGFKSKAIADNSIAVGNQAESSGDHGLAIGTIANATATDAVAVGHSANATGKYSVAIGSGNKAEGEAAVNIGSNNHGAYDHATVIGSENNIAYSDHMVDPYGDVVVGTKNTLQDSYFSIAVGNNNALSNADNSVAIGNNTSVSVAESVAIGHEAKADTVVGTSSASIGGTTYNFAGDNPVGTVSVGDVSKERTLTNVAAGRISDTSTDAVNGSQLHAVATEAAKHTVVTAGSNINVTSDTAANGGTKYTVALSNDLSVNSAAFGANTDPIHNVIDKNGVAVFNGDVDAHYNANGVSIEDRNTLDNAQYDLDGMVADSNGKHVEFTTSNITAGGQQIHDVAAGTAGTDAVNMNQLTSALNQVNGNNNALSNMVKANHQEARKGIAGTAALAGLHPLDFDPDHKLDIMAGYGHFHGTNAGAVGIAYRPNEDLMFTVGTTFGSDNVINAGVSYKVGAKSEVSRSKATLIKDLDEAKKEIAQLKADNEKIKAILEKVLGEQAADLK
jgi:outer membrane pathogenesis protein